MSRLNLLDFYVGIGTVYTNWLTLIFEESQIWGVSGVVTPLNPNLFENPSSGMSRGPISSIHTNIKVFGTRQGVRLRAVKAYWLTFW